MDMRQDACFCFAVQTRRRFCFRSFSLSYTFSKKKQKINDDHPKNKPQTPLNKATGKIQLAFYEMKEWDRLFL